MTIQALNLGSAENDGEGQNLRSGGLLINANFAELDARTVEQQQAIEQKVDKVAGKDLSANDYTSAEKSKLAAVAAEATKNGTDAALRDRATHTGTQLAATISDFGERARTVALTGYVVGANTPVQASDSLLSGIGKLQGQVAARAQSGAAASFQRLELTSATEALINGGEPHATVGLGPVISIAKNTNMVSEFIVSSDNAGFVPRFNLLKSGGMVTAPTALANTNALGAFQFVGYNGANYSAGASILGAVDGTPSAGILPGMLQFLTVNGAGAVAARWQVRSSGAFEPGTDNVYPIGSSSMRASVIYAGTGTISTSDAREKTDVRRLSDSEVSAAKALSKEVGAYKWIAAIAEKGENARNHIGMTVQRAIEIMEEHGLDPMAYGFICYDAWEEFAQQSQEEDGEPVAIPAGDRYSFRYDELNLFIAAGFEARLAALEG